MLCSLLLPVTPSPSPTHTHRGHYSGPSWKGSCWWSLSPTPSPQSSGFMGPRGHPWEHLIPFPSAAPLGARVQGWGMNTCPPAARPDSHLWSQTGHFPAWGQPGAQHFPSLLTRFDQPAFWGSPLATLKTRGVFQPLGGKLNRMCYLVHYKFTYLLSCSQQNKTKQNKKNLASWPWTRAGQPNTAEPSNLILETSKAINNYLQFNFIIYMYPTSPPKHLRKLAKIYLKQPNRYK